MFDLDAHLRRWRDETEATLAFDADELDELEEHLRTAYDSALKENLAPEAAWQRALTQLGAASALAVEYTKRKLLPAFGRLLLAWAKPGLLLIFFLASFMIPQGDTPPSWYFWAAVPPAFLGILFLLPSRPLKNAVLFGIGFSTCLIPFLSNLTTLSLESALNGPRGHWPAFYFGGVPLAFAALGLIGLPLWWWQRQRPQPETFSSSLAVAGSLILFTAMVPMFSLWLGNLSLAEIYHLPTAAEIPYTGEVRSQYLQWQFVEVLVSGCTFIISFLPYSLMLMLCLGILLHQALVRKFVPSPIHRAEVFPGPADLPWCITLLSAGAVWAYSVDTERALFTQMRGPTLNAHWQPIAPHTQMMAIFPMLLFLICAKELSARLVQARHVRPFYVQMLLLAEYLLLIGAVMNKTFFNFDYSLKPRDSSVPDWIFWTGLAMAMWFFLRQAHALWRKARFAPRPSLWKITGSDLVRIGILSGLLFAGTALVWTMIALGLAFISVSQIHCMIDWGNSTKPNGAPFDPSIYGVQDAFKGWLIYANVAYLGFCFSVGLLAAIVLSGLEFVRFNVYRLYKVRQYKRSVVLPPSEPVTEP